MILYANGKYDEAVAVVQKAIDRKRDCEGAYYILGRTLFSSGRYQEVATLSMPLWRQVATITTSTFRS